MEMFWNWTVVIAVQPREYTKTHGFVHYKGWILWYVNYI